MGVGFLAITLSKLLPYVRYHVQTRLFIFGEFSRLIG